MLSNSVLTTFLVSMIPVIELRGAIPIGTANGLDLTTAALVSIAGNLVPVPFIILFVRRVLAWMKTRPGFLARTACGIERRAAAKSGQVQKYAFWGLAAFVAVPLPGTGAWTGALIAAMLDMRLTRAFPSIALGVVGAALIISFATYGAGNLLLSIGG